MNGSSRLRRIPIKQTLFIDLMLDRTTRRIFVYTVFMILVGAVIYHYLEGWDWPDSFYFVVITLTTIGYGDFTPTKDITKLITIFYALNGVILLLTMFDVVRRVRKWEVVEEEVVSESEEHTAASQASGR